MNFEQLATLAVLAAVVVALLSDRVRVDVAAMAAAAVLMGLGVITLEDLGRGLASPALVALASLFIIARALDVTGVMGVIIRSAARMTDRMGAASAPVIITLCGSLSAFLNNTPLVILAAPIMQDSARRLGISPKRLLIPLSYASIMGGACTLIGTSTNLLVDDMAQRQHLAPFTLFEITGVGLAIAAVGAVYLAFVAPRLLPTDEAPSDKGADILPEAPPPLRLIPALVSVTVFAFVLGAAAGGLPIAVVAFIGAMALLAFQVMKPEEAYSGLRPQVLLMIGGMLVVGEALGKTGLAFQATNTMAAWTQPLGPIAALALIYVATSVLTEIMSNAAVAVLITPLAIGLAENLGVDPRPFVVAVMMAASASFATPVGYQTNAIVHQVGGYAYMDFVRVGLPLNVISAIVAVWMIPRMFPF
ncbi:MAG: SLC13 family permease [Phenylobacterium sp.]|uniref:SLC13 family permease n=1 Tax=Phenylobacterium sp. TaxID=1871053 RepID=UPI0027265317|nr:SLC13 family permease [Phenylobacterium sp.]MDO8902380.1 SLC13 family permease [Phenylobacterium sp.]MDP2214182.1 SLC13 family permease [Phenylobacterium sp.]